MTLFCVGEGKGKGKWRILMRFVTDHFFGILRALLTRGEFAVTTAWRSAESSVHHVRFLCQRTEAQSRASVLDFRAKSISAAPIFLIPWLRHSYKLSRASLASDTDRGSAHAVLA